MKTQYVKTGMVTLVSGDNTIVPAAGVAADKVVYLHAIFCERTDLAATVNLIFKDTTSPTPKEILPQISLDADAGKVFLSFERLQVPDKTRVFCEPGKGLIVNASVGSKARFWCLYSIGDQLE